MPDGICYDDDDDDDDMLDSIYSSDINYKLQSKAIKKWSENKVTFPPKNDLKVEILFR